MQDKVAISNDKSFAVINLDPKIYSLNTVYSAAYVFLDKAYIILDGDPKKVIKVYLKPKGKFDPIKMGLEFYNELLNYARYSASVKESNEITKMMIQRALFSADSSLVQEVEDNEIEDLIKELEQEEDEDAKELVSVLKDDEETEK